MFKVMRFNAMRHYRALSSLVQFAIALLISWVGLAGSVGAATYNATNLGAIPDGSAEDCANTTGTPRDMPIAVSGFSGQISDISVSITFNPGHPWRSDLIATLIAPNGTQHVLFGKVGIFNGGCPNGSPMSGTFVFVDPSVSGSQNIWSATAPGTYFTTPQGFVGSPNPPAGSAFTAVFSGLTNAQINGSWTLRIVDTVVGDTTTVTAASLTLTSLVTTATVTASPGPNGALACASPVNLGQTSSCTATPNAGYATQSISGCGGTTTALGVNTYTTGAVNANCTVSATFVQVVNGACGSANGVPVGVAPSANLCAAGTASVVATTANQFTWTCNGANTGSNANCAAPRTYVVTASPGPNGTLTCASPVTAGQTSNCAATPSSGYVTQSISGCGGTATTLGVNTYTTGTVNINCTVSATFVQVVNGACGSANGVPVGVAPSANLCAAGTASVVATAANQFTWTCNGANTGSNANCVAPRTYAVTASPGPNGTLTCASPVTAGQTSSCTATPSAGYVTQSISGCGGAATGLGVNTYTSGAVGADCTVSATFVQVVTGSCGTANGVPVGLAPSTNLCAAGTASAVSTVPSQFTWTCSGANSGSSSNCAAPRTYLVSASVNGAGGTASAAAGGVVAYNATSTVTIAPSAGYSIANVQGTCGGALIGSTYTTNAVTQDCTVIVSFVQNPIAPTVVTDPSFGGTVSCVGPTVFGGSATCSVSANNGFRLSAVSGCGGTLSNGTTYTTGPITSACTITASFAGLPVPTMNPAAIALLGLMLAMLAWGAGRRRTRT